MKTLLGFLVGTLLLAMPFQTAAQELTEEQIAEIESEVLALAESWIEGWEGLDCEKSASHMNPEGLSFLFGGKPLNHAEWLEACYSVRENQAAFNGEFLGGKVMVLTPKAAVVVFTAEQFYTYTNGNTRHYPSSAYTGLVELTDSGWLFTTFSFSNGSYVSGEGG